MESFFLGLLDDGSAAMTAYPKIFIGLGGIALIVGWSMAWVVLSNRLTHHKEIIEQYEKIIADKIPGFIPKAKSGRTLLSVWILGITIIVLIVFSLFYVNERVSMRQRRLSPSQFQIIAAHHVPPNSSFSLVISSEGGCSDCPQFAAGFEGALRQAGWKVQNSMVLGLGQRPQDGLRLILRGPKEEGDLLQNALTAAKLKFDIVPAASGPMQDSNHPEILISAQTDH
jgi:hypothetical protein